ncbi:hypothetical protein HELRODRAFT_173013 [Helobdella robusta]|uniref:DDE-1 domain-containing protein n=1 Tax=Helobdella robusta TaxID=6412 RepID=T1F696_HELRO|nr:hypothetical protein HELRODRAFT_173013 [Helobdella robusta]ESO03971.1 hypothetical protein HELRODRAFT_173013 [Helobdella robusta]
MHRILRCQHLELVIVSQPTDDEECLLKKYIKEAAALYYGLNPREVRILTYQFATTNGKVVPRNWKIDEKAGADWFSAFIKRHSHFSIRVPESTSSARVISFNRSNVSAFFDNLSKVFERYVFGPEAIYNIDETGITTVQRPSRIVAQKGVKQVGAIVSQERDQMVTLAVAVKALGNSIPPAFVFPRVHYKDHFISGGPPGSLELAHPSGWMTEINFLEVIKHLVKHARCSVENPILLLLDNHESHVSISVLDYGKNSGVIMLSFPPHCSHKLQPHDRSVFGPLKKFVGLAQDAWMKNYPGQLMTIYDIPEIVNKAFPQAATPVNQSSDQQKSNVTPEMIRPFKKAGPRKTSTGNRKKGKTQILTDTPVKAELEARQRARESKTITKKKKKILFDRNQQISRKTAKVSEKQKKSKNNIPIITSDDNTPCHLCGILANVPPFKNWKECPSCKEWFHERCCPEDFILCYSCLG